MTVSYPLPGLTLSGVVNANVKELVTQFSSHILECLSAPVDKELDILSNMTPTDALLLKIPVNVLALNGFEEWTGERNYQTPDLVATQLEARPWTRNSAYNMRAAMQGVYGGFPRIAAQTIVEGYKMRGRLIANVLKLGSTKALTYQGVPLFVGTGATTKHFLNPLDESVGTFYNLYADRPFNSTNFEFAKGLIRSLKGPDGVESLGLRLTHVVGGSAMETPFDNLLKKATILGETRQVTIGAADYALASQETNIHMGGAVSIISALLDSDPYLLAHPTGQVWYAIASNTMAKPVEMMGLNGGAPKVKVRGEGDPIADQKKQVLIDGDLEINAAAGVPHTIFRFEYAGA